MQRIEHDNPKLGQIKAYGTLPLLLLPTIQAFSCAQLPLFFREFEGSIQRYQWFFTELPEMLCESEMEVEQHTCWSGQDVVERSVCIKIHVLFCNRCFFHNEDLERGLNRSPELQHLVMNSARFVTHCSLLLLNEMRYTT